MVIRFSLDAEFGWTHMPVIPIPTAACWPNGLDVATVLAIMVHPDNESARADLLLPVKRRELIVEIDQMLDRLHVPTDAKQKLGELVEVESGADSAIVESFEQALLKVLHQGLAVGERLLFLRYLSTVYPERSTIQQATELMANRKRGRGFPSSRSTIKNAWRSHRSVAPLWAALFLAHIGRDPRADPLTVNGLPGFLALAEDFRVFGEKKTMQDGSRRVAVLPVGSSWQVPADLLLPSVEVQMTLSYSDGEVAQYLLE